MRAESKLLRASGLVGSRVACLTRRQCLMLAAMLESPLSLARAPGAARSALVLGNAEYSIGRLPNAVSDARAMAKALAAIGFAVVGRYDTVRNDLIEAMKAFALRTRGSAVRLVYYAGHGIQYKGSNYLVAVNSHVQAEEEIPAKCADLSELIHAMEPAAGGINIFVLDACRINPFVEGVFVDARGRPRRVTRGPSGLRPGLQEMSAPAGSYIAYAASPNAPAFDGPGGAGSYFTRHLLARLREPGLPIELLFKRVREAVKAETHGRQIPWDSSSLTGDFCFVPNAQGGCRA